MTQNSTDADQPIAWRAIVEDEPVRSSDGEAVGTVYDVVGSKEDDIFHGIVVHLGRLGHRVLVMADDVTLITAIHVDVSLTSAQAGCVAETRGRAHLPSRRDGAVSKARWLDERQGPLTRRIRASRSRSPSARRRPRRRAAGLSASP